MKHLTACVAAVMAMMVMSGVAMADWHHHGMGHHHHWHHGWHHHHH